MLALELHALTRMYESEREKVDEFIAARLALHAVLKEKLEKKLKRDILKLHAKLRFMCDIVSGALGTSHRIADCVKGLIKAGYPAFPPGQGSEEDDAEEATFMAITSSKGSSHGFAYLLLMGLENNYPTVAYLEERDYSLMIALITSHKRSPQDAWEKDLNARNKSLVQDFTDFKKGDPHADPHFDEE